MGVVNPNLEGAVFFSLFFFFFFSFFSFSRLLSFKDSSTL